MSSITPSNHLYTVILWAILTRLYRFQANAVHSLMAGEVCMRSVFPPPPRHATASSLPAHSLHALDAKMDGTIQRANAAHLEPSKGMNSKPQLEVCVACHIEQQHTARPLPQAQDEFCFGSEQHGRVIGYQAGPKQQPDAPDRRVVSLPLCGSSSSALTRAAANKLRRFVRVLPEC